MEWNEDIDLTKRKFSSQLIVRGALSRGWKVAGFLTNPAIFLIYIPGKTKPVKIFSASPPQMSYPAAKIAKDKFITNQILRDQGLPVPKELLLDYSNLHEDSMKINRFMKEQGEIVVKPLDASHGKGVTVGVNTPEKLNKALDYAAENATSPHLLLQECIEGVDIRVVCIDYKFTDSISRIPATVVGDGKHAVSELIQITNSSDYRAENYKARLNVIPMNKAEEFIGVDTMNSIPQQGERVQVIGVSNVGMGGERHNIKHDLPDFIKDMAIKCAEALELPVCGVDFMVKRLPQPDDTIDSLAPSIIEVNECPMLTMYDVLESQEQVKVIDKYLDYIALSA